MVKNCTGQYLQDLHADLVEWAERWANEGKLVLVAALDGTFKRQPFLPVLQLVSLAEDVTKLKAVCAHCHREAAFTHRKSPEDAVEVQSAPHPLQSFQIPPGMPSAWVDGHRQQTWCMS